MVDDAHLHGIAPGSTVGESPRKVFGQNLGEVWAIWTKFGRKELTNLGKIWEKVIKIWANLIGFGQNQNLASPKTLDFLRLWRQATQLLT